MTDDATIPPPPDLPEDLANQEKDELAASFDRLETIFDEEMRTIKKALNELRSLVLAHYDRTTRRADEHARRIRRLESHLGLTPEPSWDDGL